MSKFDIKMPRIPFDFDITSTMTLLFLLSQKIISDAQVMMMKIFRDVYD